MEYNCTFCGKGQREVKKIFVGPSSNICNECIGMCAGLLVEDGDCNENIRLVAAFETLPDVIAVAQKSLATLRAQLKTLAGVPSAVPVTEISPGSSKTK